MSIESIRAARETCSTNDISLPACVVVFRVFESKERLPSHGVRARPRRPRLLKGGLLASSWICQR
jgi:hypothetical protein